MDGKYLFELTSVEETILYDSFKKENADLRAVNESEFIEFLKTIDWTTCKSLINHANSNPGVENSAFSYLLDICKVDDYSNLDNAIATAEAKKIIQIETIDGKKFIQLGRFLQWQPGKGFFAQMPDIKPLLWEAIGYSKRKQSALLLCKNIVEYMPYDATDWEHSGPCEWLNGEFYNETFDEDEKKLIIDCSTKVFLLSLEELDKCTLEHRHSASEKRIRTNFSGVADAWWLRSSGHQEGFQAYVLYDGYVHDSGKDIHSNKVGVCPAIWISLNP